MKKCSYCGKEYSDDATVCALDGQPLEPDEPKPPIQVSPAPKSFDRTAAKFSLATPFVVVGSFILLFAFLQSHGRTRPTTFMLIALLPILLILAGLALGIIGLALTKRSEQGKQFGMALAGVCLNTLFLVLLVLVPFVLPLFLLGKNFPTTPQGRLEAAVRKVASAATEQERFYALNDAAKESFELGKMEDAHKFANDLLTLAPKFPRDWNYGNAIYDGNLVLGRIDVREGRIAEAKEHLLAAGKSPGSPQLDSFGPNMSLAKDLLEKGERDVVIQYFDLCRKFWKMDRSQLDDWNQEVKAGRIPDFGANLIY